MSSTATLAAAALALTGLIAPASASADPGFEDAFNIRELSMMLMATSLRCRTSYYDFRAEIEEFNRINLDLLNRASMELRRGLQQELGEQEGSREFDRIGTELANRYGGGHPSLDCAQLKDIAIELTVAFDHEQLADVAYWLRALPERGGGR
jgi:hypothetical protein